MSGEDTDVLTRAKRGDRDAFAACVRQYHKRVYATALQITGNRDDAADVTQESFLRAFRHIASFDGRADFFTWLYRITVNSALNHLRQRKRADKIAQAGAAEVAAEGGVPERLGAAPRTPAEWMELGEQYRRVLTEVCALSPSLRVTLVLATVEGKSYREIAEILDVPEGTVAWRVNEARRQIRERLAAGDSGADKAAGP